jgi:hypothetical protein
MTKPRSVAATANDNSIPGNRIEDGSVSGDKLEDGAVSSSKLSSVSGSLIEDGTVTQSKLDSSVAFPPEDGSVTDAKVANNAAISSGKLSYQSDEAGSVAVSVKAKFEDEVWITDFGAIKGNNQANAAVNSAAIAAAVATGKVVRIPSGTFWVNPMTFTQSVNIVGEDINRTIIRRVGGGATFRWASTAYNTFRRMTLYGNGSGITFHYDYGPGNDTGQNTFEEIYCRSDDYGLKVQCLTVFWQITNCYFNGLNIAREFSGGAWANREYGNWTWFCNKALVVRGSGFSNSLVNCVMQDITQEAVIIDVDQAGAQIGEWLFETVFFEAVGKSGAHPIVDVRTSAVGRLRCVTFDNCIFTPGPHPNPTYICQITQGGGGNVRLIKFRNSFLNYGAVPTTNLNYTGVIFENNEFGDTTTGDNRIRSQQIVPVQVPFGNQGRVVPVLATAPASPLTGEMYFDTSLSKMRCWDGSTWQNFF